MPYIEGLEEQNAALTRIKNNLADVEKINKSLTIIKKYSAEPVEAEYKLECKFVLADGSLQKTKTRIVLDEIGTILNAINKHKSSIVEEIKKDSEAFHISLTEQEKAILGNE